MNKKSSDTWNSFFIFSFRWWWLCYRHISEAVKSFLRLDANLRKTLPCRLEINNPKTIGYFLFHFHFIISLFFIIFFFLSFIFYGHYIFLHFQQSYSLFYTDRTLFFVSVSHWNHSSAFICRCTFSRGIFLYAKSTSSYRYTIPYKIR